MILAYGVIKIVDFSDSKEFKIESRKLDWVYTADQFFSHSDGFQIAAGLTEYDGSNGLIEDPEIGTIKFYLKSFSHDEHKLSFTEVESRPCEQEDFNFGTEGSVSEYGLFPITQNSKEELH